MKKITILIITTILISISANTLAAEVLKDPGPIPIPAGLSHENIVKAIKLGMQKRGWEPMPKGDNKIVAILSTRGGKHVVHVSIEFDDKAVKLSYLDSVNMGYKIAVPETLDPWGSGGNTDEVPVIHPKYNSWVKNLANDIRETLSVAKYLK